MKKSGNGHLLIVFTALIIFWGLFVFVLRANLDSHVRFFSDDGDKSVYFHHSQWYSERLIPYVDVFSEYPQVPTYLFGVPNAIYELFFPGRPFFYILYDAIFTALMLVFLGAAILLLTQMAPPEKKHYAYLLLLPGTFYFSINRYDILPAFLCLLAYHFLTKERFSIAGILLGIGALTKWYPALLLPVFLLYEYRVRKTWPIKSVFVFGLTCLLILLPTYLAGGLDALLVPYRFHAERNLETVSLPVMVASFLSYLSISFPSNTLIVVFLALQLSGLVVLLFYSVTEPKGVLNASIVIIGCFIFFARIYSPQWLLWVSAFLILAIEKRKELFLFAAYNLSAYIGCPIILDLYGLPSPPLFVANAINLSLLAFIIIIALRKLRYVGLGGSLWNPRHTDEQHQHKSLD
jgi:uncharacterized membrane protein